jgi:hypothetical protein
MNKTTTATSVADTENLPEHMGSSPILLWGLFAEFRVVMSVTIFCSSVHTVVCRRAYLCYLCLFEYSGV